MQQHIDETRDIVSDNLQQKPTPSRKQANMAPRWAAIIGLLALGVLYALLPQNLIIGPNWLLLAVEAIFVLPLAISSLTPRGLSHSTIRVLALILLGIVTIALAIGIVLLIIAIAIAVPSNIHPTVLLRSAALLWFFNVLVFALWYWEIDGGGPLKRHQAGHEAADFIFPQQTNRNDGSWAPHFFDYLFVAFTGATALSPADTYPLTRPAKALMMIEAILSMTIIVLLIGRAVNILGT